MYQDGQVND